MKLRLKVKLLRNVIKDIKIIYTERLKRDLNRHIRILMSTDQTKTCLCIKSSNLSKKSLSNLNFRKRKNPRIKVLYNEKNKRFKIIDQKIFVPVE